MRARVISTFIVFVILLTSSHNVLMVLPYGDNFGLTTYASAAPPFSGGDGSAGNPFQISNVSQLQNMSADLAAHYILISDINASATKTWNGGLGFNPIGNDTNSSNFVFDGLMFNGSFDGQDFKIFNLTINRPTEHFVGVFGQINDSVVIKNVDLVNFMITGYRNVGGLVGYNLEGTVENCSIEGIISGGLNLIGGLIGNNKGELLNCSANIDVNGQSAGGIVGGNAGTVANCTSFGTLINSVDRQGGIVGYAWTTSVIIDSISYVRITGQGSYKGGLVGICSGLVKNCVSYNITSGTTGIGNLLGSNSGRVENCQAFERASGTSTGIGGLIGQNSATGTVLNCTAFGNATGNSYVGGLIGWNNGGITDNCSAFGAVSASSYSGGGLVGKNSDGIISNCSASGKVSGVGYEKGGLVGENTGPIAKVIQSYCTGDVVGTNQVGGLIGNNSDNAVVNNSYSHSKVNGTMMVGGLMGRVHSAKVSNSYSKGLVLGTTLSGGMIGHIYNSKINNSYWDTETSNQGSSGGGVGKNTADMKKKATYTGSGWDFSNIWGIGEGNTYPFFLRWYNPPKIITYDNGTSIEDLLYKVDYNAYVSDYPAINTIKQWTLSTNASDWLTINNNGRLSGIPENADVGTYWVEVKVSDSAGRMDSHNFTIKVSNVNDPPEINISGVPNSANEDELYSTTVEAIDIDPTNDVLTWSMDTNANWLSLNSINGALTGTPINDDSEISFWVNITVMDEHMESTFENFSIFVNNINDPPEIQTIELTDAVEDTAFFLNFDAVDIDPTGDVKTWSLNTGTNWMMIDTQFGVLNGTPENKDVGSNWINVTVDDGNGGIDWVNFTLEILNVNDPPMITTEDVTSAEPDKLYSVDYEATDIDPSGDTLTWTVHTNASWLAIDSTTGVLSGTPEKTDLGTYWVEVTVGDGNGGLDNTNFTITVPKATVIQPPPPENKRPLIITNNVLTAEDDKLYSVLYEAIDNETSVSELVWSLDSNASWLFFDDASNRLQGTPNETDVGSYWVKISVEDTDGGMISTNFTLTVFKSDKPEENEKPKLSNGKMSPSKGDTETEFVFSVTYTDEDNDPGEVWIWLDGIKYEMTKDPNDDNNTDGVIYTYKTELDEGEHNYYFTADDGKEPAVAVDSTPIDTESAVSIPEIKKPVEQEDEDAMLVILGIVIILIIIILLALIMIKRSRKLREQEDELEEDMEDLEDDMEDLEEDLEDEEPVDEDLEDEELEKDEEPIDEEELEDGELDDEELVDEEPVDEEEPVDDDLEEDDELEEE